MVDDIFMLMSSSSSFIRESNGDKSQEINCPDKSASRYYSQYLNLVVSDYRNVNRQSLYFTRREEVRLESFCLPIDDLKRLF